MSQTYITAALRREVIARAEGLCEYCLIHEDETILGCQVDHIISEKHGGLTASKNLAYCCTLCNRAKGSDVGSIDWESREFVRFFNPRTDQWGEHFRIVGHRIEATTRIGAVTLRILDLNSPNRVAERMLLGILGQYPHANALKRMSS